MSWSVNFVGTIGRCRKCSSRRSPCSTRSLATSVNSRPESTRHRIERLRYDPELPALFINEVSSGARSCEAGDKTKGKASSATDPHREQGEEQPRRSYRRRRTRDRCRQPQTRRYLLRPMFPDWIRPNRRWRPKWLRHIPLHNSAIQFRCAGRRNPQTGRLYYWPACRPHDDPVSPESCR